MENDTLNGGNNTNVTTVFWIIGIIAVLWNLMGVSAFVFDMMKGEDDLALLSEAERALYENDPIWHKIVYGLATLGGLIGSIGLVMRKKWAETLFLVSLVAVIIQFLYGVFGTDSREVMGNIAVILPLMIALIAAFLWYYAKKCNAKGWLS